MSQFPSAPSVAILWEKIDEQTLAIAVASIVFSGINTSFTFLRLTGYVVKDGTASNLFYRVNNDSGANYDFQRLIASGGSGTGARTSTTTFSAIAFTNIASNQEASFTTLFAKPLAAQEGLGLVDSNPQIGAGIELELLSGQWNNTADLVNRIDVITSGGNLAADTRILLEGAKPA